MLEPAGDTYEGGVRIDCDDLVSGKGFYRGIYKRTSGGKNDRDILVRITVLAEFPATADFRAARVETRTVGPPFPPVVLHYAVSGDWVGRLNGTHPPRAA
jgi:hypothetical protein